mmetsp:Transcript_23142/g.77687  ORF Transcript_23142/g.77687 Transcript_23142/m.77687 type:complete len:195 (-) Transcript_23142:127-711(-)
MTRSTSSCARSTTGSGASRSWGDLITQCAHRPGPGPCPAARSPRGLAPHAAQRTAPKVDDETALEIVPGQRAGAYRYFGAAKNLPGVRELFQQQAEARAKKTRAQLHKGIDADYYGYRDDDDGVLAKLEAEVEEKARREAAAAWQGPSEEDAAGSESAFVAHVPLPSDAQIQKAILEKRKRELIERYLGGEEAR